MNANPVSSRDVAREGAYWCRACRRFSEANTDREMLVCALCGRPALRWCPPAQATVAPSLGHELFERLRREAGLEAA